MSREMSSTDDLASNVAVNGIGLCAKLKCFSFWELPSPSLPTLDPS